MLLSRLIKRVVKSCVRGGGCDIVWGWDIVWGCGSKVMWMQHVVVCFGFSICYVLSQTPLHVYVYVSTPPLLRTSPLCLYASAPLSFLEKKHRLPPSPFLKKNIPHTVP